MINVKNSNSTPYNNETLYVQVHENKIKSSIQNRTKKTQTDRVSFVLPFMYIYWRGSYPKYINVRYCYINV